MQFGAGLHNLVLKKVKKMSRLLFQSYCGLALQVIIAFMIIKV